MIEEQKRYINVNEDHFTKVFETLPVVDLINLSPERANAVISFARRIASNYIKSRISGFNNLADENLVSLKERYHLASNILTRLSNNKVFMSPLKEEIELESDVEKSLLALIVCDDKCKYYKLYEEKKNEGLDNDSIINYLDFYYGIRSPKLVQLERYYQVLMYRLDKNKDMEPSEEVLSTTKQR